MSFVLEKLYFKEKQEKRFNWWYQNKCDLDYLLNVHSLT